MKLQHIKQIKSKNQHYHPSLMFLSLLNILLSFNFNYNLFRNNHKTKIKKI